jgi:ubiquinone/menaquinone biosynthesis C-methylase UbiE
VLELAAGTGLHTYIIAQRGARVTASDISSNSLKVISQQIENIYTTAADMESLPFENNSFDISNFRLGFCI